MSFNTFGKIFRFTTWGESHGPAIGCIVDGCPPNIQIKVEEIQKELNKRNSNNKNFNKEKILKEYGVGAQILSLRK